MAINNLKKIIINEIKLFLAENITSVVYHFCSYSSLMNIIKDDAFRLTPKQLENDKRPTKKDNFYLCVTRQVNGDLGYSRSYPVRIVLDGNLLMNNYHGKPYNFFAHDTYNTKTKYHNDIGQIDKFQTEVESEDRIYSVKPYIENVRKYIKCVDININSPLFKYYLDLKEVINFFGEDHVNIFTDTKSFTQRNLKNKIPFEKVFIENIGKEKEEYDKEKVFYAFVSILYYVYKDIYKLNVPFFEFCDEVIKKFNLEKFSIDIQNAIKQNNYDSIYKNQLATNIFKLREIPNMNDYKKIMKPINILLNLNRKA